MSGHMTTNTDHITRANLWTMQTKTILEDELMGMGHVRMLSEFPDGDTFNIPSIGQLEAYDYVEGQPVVYNQLDTGNFTFSITDYKMSGTYITNKMKQDSYLASELISMFPMKQARAIMTQIEEDILTLGPDAQTASNLNNINGAPHRFVSGGASQAMNVEAFAKARYSLQKANVPMTNLIAIVDPSVEYTMNTISNITNVSNNPKWEGILSSSIGNGTKFLANIYGFDVYTSPRLKQGMSETINAVAVTNGVANLFFSAASDVLPFVGAIRQPLKVESEYNKDYQREEYVTSCRYGFKLFRPENMVTVLSSTAVV